jgi:hypothetical protein
MRTYNRVGAVVLVVSACAIAGPAFAQEASRPGVDLSPALTQLSDAVFLGVQAAGLALIGFLTRWVAKKLGNEKLAENDAIRGYLNAAFTNAIGFAHTKFRSYIAGSGRKLTRIEIENDLVRFAVGFMLGKVPDALKHFGITEEGIRDMIVARLPEDLLDPAKYTDVINAPVATPAAAPA